MLECFLFDAFLSVFSLFQTPYLRSSVSYELDYMYFFKCDIQQSL